MDALTEQIRIQVLAERQELKAQGIVIDEEILAVKQNAVAVQKVLHVGLKEDYQAVVQKKLAGVRDEAEARRIMREEAAQRRKEDIEMKQRVVLQFTEQIQLSKDATAKRSNPCWRGSTQPY